MDKLIKLLNNMLSQEYACAIRYATHADFIKGAFSESVKSKLKEISDYCIMAC